MSIEDLVNGPLPQFGYQMHLASGEVEKMVKDETTIRQFLQGMYGGKGPNDEQVFVPEKGVVAENLGLVGESRILNGKVSDFLLMLGRVAAGKAEGCDTHVCPSRYLLQHARTAEVEIRELGFCASLYLNDQDRLSLGGLIYFFEQAMVY